jgi:hypothetical protein
MTAGLAGKGSGARLDFFHFPGDAAMWYDRKQEMFFVRVEQTPSERQRIPRTPKLLVHETMAN